MHVGACLLACMCDNSILVYSNTYLHKNTGINNSQGNELVIFSKDVSVSTVTSHRLDDWYSSFRNSKIVIFTAIFIYLLIQCQLLFSVGLIWSEHEVNVCLQLHSRAHPISWSVDHRIFLLKKSDMSFTSSGLVSTVSV